MIQTELISDYPLYEEKTKLEEELRLLAIKMELKLSYLKLKG
jgi:hypothetical protein